MLLQHLKLQKKLKKKRKKKLNEKIFRDRGFWFVVEL